MKVVEKKKKKLVTLNSSGALQARLNECDRVNSTQIRDPELSEVGVRFNRAKIFYRSDSTRSMGSMETSIVTSCLSFEC